MRIRVAALRRLRLTVVIAFVLACALFLAWMWSFTGTRVPFFTADRDYAVSADVDTVRNLVPFADVQIAGVRVGVVETIGEPGPGSPGRRLELRLDDVAAPLHEGASIQVSEKSPAGQYYVDVIDGTGPPLASGTLLPPQGVRPSVDLRDVLASLDAPTRASMGGFLRSAGAGTADRGPDVGRLVEGLARLGRGGAGTLDALAAQSRDLTALSSELQTVFAAVDTQRGRIAQVVTDADRITSATAGQRRAVEESVDRLPGVLGSATNASGDLRDLARSLTPVAADLNRAAPDLSAALEQLPATTQDLRGLLPVLDETLRRAPATLDRARPAGARIRALVPPATRLLCEVNPALRYMKPYGRETAQFFANFAAGMSHPVEDGDIYIPLAATENPNALQPTPLPFPEGILTGENAYPRPGTLADRQPQGPFQRIQACG